MFKIELGNGHIVMAQVSGRLRQRYIKVLPNDEVIVELSQYDLSKGRILVRK